MARIDAEIDEVYGNFVKHRLASYVPVSERPDRMVQVQEVSGEGDFEERYKKYEKDLKVYNVEYEHRRIQHKLRSATNRYRAVYFLLFLGSLFLTIASSHTDAGFFHPPFLIFAAFSILFVLSSIFAVQDALIMADLFPYNPPTEQKLMADYPKPILPDDIKIITKDVPEPPVVIRNDALFDEYRYRVLTYRTEANCLICNSLIKFSKIRKIPFEDKCESCEYTFTFIYKKRTERYKTSSYGKRGGTKEKSHYIEYDGIEPTRARSPSKSRNVSGAHQRKTISKDVKKDVWNRDDGKCIQCGSNENLEFDHIIPVSRGGANTFRNIQLLCEECNREKSDNIS